MAIHTVFLPDTPWPIDWEQRPEVDACTPTIGAQVHELLYGQPHNWERISAEQSPGVLVKVERCSRCLTPRCEARSQLQDHLRCTQRRHHRSVHSFIDGREEAIGGASSD